MKYIDSANVDDICHSSCQVEDQLYVASGECVVLMQQGAVSTMLRPGGIVYCVRMYDSHFYLLRNNCDSAQWFIHKYRHNGEPVMAWSHYDTDVGFNQFAIHNGTLYVPSRSTETLRRYSCQSGAPAGKCFPLKLSNSGTSVSMCSTPAGFLVLSLTLRSKVVCINPETGKERWKQSDIIEPRGVTADGLHSVLVCTGTVGTKIIIDVLKADSGEPSCPLPL